MQMKPLVNVVIGPTAVGKTDFAIQEAKKFGGVVISADSRQIYAGMNIGTAKPKAAWQDTVQDVLIPNTIDGVPHYLFNVAAPDTPWTLAHWQEAAYQVLSHVTSAGTPVWLVGGTMLYVDSIVLAFMIPEVAPNPVLREQLEQESTDVLYQKLIHTDPQASAFIEAHHKQRIIRALEVMEATGKAFSLTRTRQESPYQFTITGLFPGDASNEASWNILRERIQSRAQSMMTDGLMEETQKLMSTYSPTLLMLQTMNYKQVMKVLSQEISPTKAVEEMVSVNMKYTHRQMSWWRKRTDIHWRTI